MIAPDRLKLTRTVMSIGVATEAAGGFQHENSRSKTSFSELTWVPGPAGAGAGPWLAGPWVAGPWVAGPWVAGWPGCGVAGTLGDGACARAIAGRPVRSSVADR